MAGSFRHSLVDGKTQPIHCLACLAALLCSLLSLLCQGAAVTDGTVRQAKKVQHGAEAFTDIISLIIALSPE
jgi:hypothetical protein